MDQKVNENTVKAVDMLLQWIDMNKNNVPDDAKEREALEESYDDAWRDCGEVQFINKISADLYMVEESEIFLNDSDTDPWSMRKRLARTAIDEGEFRHALDLIRLGYDKEDAGMVASWRAEIFNKLGLPKVAKRFESFASVKLQEADLDYV